MGSFFIGQKVGVVVLLDTHIVTFGGGNLVLKRYNYLLLPHKLVRMYSPIAWTVLDIFYFFYFILRPRITDTKKTRVQNY